MIVGDLLAAILANRFNAGQRKDALRWLNRRYVDVWNEQDWPFKLVGPTDLVVSGQTAEAPEDFRSVRSLVDANGDPIEYLTPTAWENIYAADTSTGSNPDSYTIIGKTFYFGPAASGTFKLSYKRRLVHLDGVDGNVVLGALAADADVPVWDAEHHEFLVAGARATGLRDENDPTADQQELEFRVGLEAMAADYGVYASTGPIQYGRDTL